MFLQLEGIEVVFSYFQNPEAHMGGVTKISSRPFGNLRANVDLFPTMFSDNSLTESPSSLGKTKNTPVNLCGCKSIQPFLSHFYFIPYLSVHKGKLSFHVYVVLKISKFVFFETIFQNLGHCFPSFVINLFNFAGFFVL